MTSGEANELARAEAELLLDAVAPETATAVVVTKLSVDKLRIKNALAATEPGADVQRVVQRTFAGCAFDPFLEHCSMAIYDRERQGSLDLAANERWSLIRSESRS